MTDTAGETGSRGELEFEALLDTARFLRATTEAASRLTSLLDFDRVLETATSMLVEEFDAVIARIWLSEPSSRTLYLRAEMARVPGPAATEPGELHLSALPIWLDEVVRTRRVFIQADLSSDPRFDQEWVSRSAIGAVAAFPLMIGKDLHGVMTVFTRRPLPDALVEVLASFAAIVTASLHDVQLFVREQEARAEAEEARRRSAFLAEASAVLTSSLDYETTLRSIARLVVPDLADWCVVDVLEREGVVRRIEVAHSDPDRLAMAQEFSRRYEGDPASGAAALRVIRTGRSQLVHEITDQMLEAAATDPERLALWRGLGLRSYMCVPVTAHGRTHGAITFIASRPGRRFGQADLALAEDLGRRVAIAVDNAFLYQELQEAIRIRDEFLSSVSHDLKNPIAAIKGRAQMLERRTRHLPEEERERFDKGLTAIDVAATRMSWIINDLVDLARLRIGQPLELNRTPVDLVELVNQVVSEQHASAGSTLDAGAATGEMTSQPPPIHVIAEEDQIAGTWDATRLHRVLTNLISNAIKYSPDGGEIVVRVGVETSSSGQTARVSVRDRGIGIPAQDLGHVFERYHRASNVTGHFEGSGIGLAAARQIVEQHGGRISVESTEGEGSTFVVELPLNDEP